MPAPALEIADIQSEADDDEQPKEWTNFDYFKSAMNSVGLHRQCRSTKINTKTTPCIVNDPRGCSHVVVQKRLRDAFSIDVLLFRHIVQMAFDEMTWCEDDVVPHIVELRRNRGCQYLRAEEITLIVLHDGFITINPNKDWSAGTTFLVL
jgi:hypothetical protein